MVTDESNRRTALKNDYKDKANSFANWFTSIIISDFVYMVNVKHSNFQSILPRQWETNFYYATFALIGIFLFKLLGVGAAYERLAITTQNEGACIKWIERVRVFLFCAFIVFGLFALIYSFNILIS